MDKPDALHKSLRQRAKVVVYGQTLGYIPDWPTADARITVALASGEAVLSVLFPALTSPKRSCFGLRSGGA